MIHEEGNEEEEEFNLPNGYYIKMDYGVPNFDGDYIPITKRFNGTHRRTVLYDENMKIISQVLEDNPDRVDDEEFFNGPKDDLLWGNETEKVIPFDDGKVAKVEYWITPYKFDSHFGRYETKFRRIVLFDENKEIISEIIEDNPNYRKDGKYLIKPNYSEEELEELSRLIV